MQKNSQERRSLGASETPAPGSKDPTTPFYPRSSLTPSRQIFQPDLSRRYWSIFSATASLTCAAVARSIEPKDARGLGVAGYVRLRPRSWVWEAGKPGPGLEPRVPPQPRPQSRIGLNRLIGPALL